MSEHSPDKRVPDEQSAPDRKAPTVISDDQFEAARGNQAAGKLLKFALEQEKNLEREDLIHP